MREGFLLPGAILVILMLTFSFVPLPNSVNGTACLPSATCGTASQPSSLKWNPQGFPFAQPAPLTVTWTGGAPGTWVEVVPCGNPACSNVNTGTGVDPERVAGVTAVGRGPSGSLTLDIQTNLSVIIFTNNAGPLSITASLNEMPEFGFIWEVLLLVGLLLLVVGLLLPEKGQARGHQRQSHYVHWRHQPFLLPDHLPSEGLVCAACGLEDIPHEDDSCPRCHAPLKGEVAGNRGGQSLVVEDEDPLKPWKVIHGLNFAPADILIMTREKPEVLAQQFHLGEALIYTLSRAEHENTLSPTNPEAIFELADRHFQARPKGLVVLTDANYLVTHMGYDQLRRLVHNLQDLAQDRGGSFLLGLDPNTLARHQRAQLEERMHRLV